MVSLLTSFVFRIMVHQGSLVGISDVQLLTLVLLRRGLDDPATPVTSRESRLYWNHIPAPRIAYTVHITFYMELDLHVILYRFFAVGVSIPGILEAQVRIL